MKTTRKITSALTLHHKKRRLLFLGTFGFALLATTICKARADQMFGFYLLTLPRAQTNIIGGHVGSGDNIYPPRQAVATTTIQSTEIQQIYNQAEHDTLVRAKLFGIIGGSFGGSSSGLTVDCFNGLQIITYDGRLPLPFGDSTIIESALQVTSFTVRDATGQSNSLSASIVAQKLKSSKNVPGTVNVSAASSGTNSCDTATNATASKGTSSSPNIDPAAAPIVVAASDDNSRVHVAFTKGTGLIIGIKRLQLHQVRVAGADTPIKFDQNNDTNLAGDTDDYRLQFAASPQNSSKQLCVDVTQIQQSSVESVDFTFCPTASHIKISDGRLPKNYTPPRANSKSIQPGLTTRQENQLIGGWPLEFDSSNIDLGNLIFTFSDSTAEALDKVDGSMNVHKNLFAGRYLD